MDRVAQLAEEAERCVNCGGSLSWLHDHRLDNSGLDDGPPLRGERRKPTPKTAAELRSIRLRAWATRRSKYGLPGHRGSYER